MNMHTPTDPSTPAPRAVDLSVSGMTCANCARHVTEAIQAVPGVHSAAVSLEKGRASVRWAAGAAPAVGALLAAIREAGYGAEVEDTGSRAGAAAGRGPARWHLTLWVGVLGTALLMLGEWLLGLGPEPWFRWASFALAGLVQAVAGGPFYRGAWRQLKAGASNMDTLVALGSSTAFGYSAWALLSGHGGHLHFMEAASIITLISVGHAIEARVSARASGALRQLLNLAPPTARRLDPGGREAEVPVAALAIGDRVALRPGDRVPTDGEVAEGDSAVDETMLTGESAPVDKAAGSRLFAGTVNVNGRLVMRVTATGEETALAHIIASVQRAQTSRAAIQRIGDRVSNVFVPVVVVVAILAGLWWGLAPEQARSLTASLAPYLWTPHPPAEGLAAALIIAAAVLIIACPCAMGLATPAAIMAGSNAAARRGILVRDGVALEKAGTVTAVVFDKTGTLTAGKPDVAEIWEQGSRFPPGAGPRAGSPAPALAGLAAGLASHSAHPISQALARMAAPEPGGIRDWSEVRGAGVKAVVIPPAAGSGPDGVEARLGSLAWLRESGVDLAPGEAFIAEWSGQGATLAGLALGPALRALYAVKDSVKPGAAGVVATLRRQGLKIFLLTGDNARTAAGIARQAGLEPERVFAEVRPEQKAAFVAGLQRQGERVAFVGDGINDAPALEQADLGIAVSRASDVAREAADIILLNSEIEAVPESLGLAQATLRTIRQNLFWAFFYNAAGVPLAALGFMSPILCAAAMGVSDLIVIGNTLRLYRWKLGARPPAAARGAPAP